MFCHLNFCLWKFEAPINVVDTPQAFLHHDLAIYAERKHGHRSGPQKLAQAP